MTTPEQAFEVNFDGIVGPTHNYSGLSYGNVASMDNKDTVSNPRAAALQGLEKMKVLYDMGCVQAVLPPHERPHIPTLKYLGFRGSDVDIAKAAFSFPNIYNNVMSSAAMWTANAATVTPSTDTTDRRVNISPANLMSKFHRAIEANFTYKILNKIFNDRHLFHVHPPLPNLPPFPDEGAANHTRFCRSHSDPGVHLFVYGFKAFKSNSLLPSRFPPRQSQEASLAIARRHQIPTERVIAVQQNPRAIDNGVFHNDVISVGNESFFLCHEEAFVTTDVTLEELRKKVEFHCSTKLNTLIVPANRISLDVAVKTYLFNSQLITLKDKSMAMIAPAECQDHPHTKEWLDEMLKNDDCPINNVQYFNLLESMRNGGGPACLRLRIVLNEKEIKTSHQGIYFSDILYRLLKAWITKHYRDRLSANDLADPKLIIETQTALDELTQILKLGPVYSFQKSEE